MLKITNLKVFGDDPQGVDTLEKFNIIVGKNNSGKSTFLDAIEKACHGENRFERTTWRDNKAPALMLSATLSSEFLKGIWQSTHDTLIPNGSNSDYVCDLLDGIEIHWDENDNSKTFKWWSYEKFDDPLSVKNGCTMPKRQAIDRFKSSCVEHAHSILKGSHIERLDSERDIRPGAMFEPDYLLSNGNGATSYITNYLTKAELPSDLVEIDLLLMLNEVCSPDYSYDRISCQMKNESNSDGEFWEIYLHTGKLKVALSNLGSGLKTVILVLLVLLKSKAEERNVYLLEELEVNLHPSILRNLLLYLYDYSCDTGSMFFITTHSNIPIDLFYKRENSQVILFSLIDDTTTCRAIKSIHTAASIITELDFRASDLFLTNCVVWVEGPSDRLYINKWIDMRTSGKLREGEHYVCICYGGKLLSHYTFNSSEMQSELIDLLRVNHNNYVVIDSDKKDVTDKINDTKTRIVAELFDSENSWITDGKEIENYLSMDLLKRSLELDNAVEIDKYANVFDEIESSNAGKGKKWKVKKAQFAAKICSHMEEFDIEAEATLATRVDSLLMFILAANKQSALHFEARSN